ncbi:MAG: Hint domain-containing protein, partial [Pseudomonadota bacterium]
DDVIDAGAGNDSIDAGIDNDTVFGGTGDDTMAAGQGDDSFYGGDDRDTLVLSDGFGADTFEGGEGGTDTDVIDASALSAGVTATLTGNEVGTLTDGTDTVTFAEVETLTLTDQNDTLDASAAAAPVTVNAGAGDDTLTGGTGADSLGGGAGDDTFALVDGFGGDTITGDETAETVGDTLYASAVTGDTAVALSGDGEGTLTNGTDTANFDGIEIIETGAGDDTINAAADTAGLTLTGGDGDDSITGGAGDDLITGDGGTSAASGAWTYSYWDLDPTGDPRTLAQAGFTENGGRDHADVPTETGFTDVIDPTAFDTADDYALKFTTALEVNTGGTYTFATTSDDGSKMYINGVEVVDNGGHHGAITRTGTVDLSPGTHIIEIVYYENNGGNSLSATLSGPDTGGSTTALTGYGGLTAPRDPGNDTLDGGAGADTIFAGDGADTVRLSDGFGDDTIFGGDGGEDTDTLDLSGLSQGIDITLSANEDGTATAAGDTATFDDIEAFLLTDAADTFAGGAATDGLTLDAGAGDDRVTGGAGADRIALGAGDDTARVGQGDSVSGGDGDDIFTLTDTTGAGTVTIIGGEGDETAGDTLDFSGLLDKGSIVITDDDDASGGISGYGFLTDGTRVEFSEIETIICFARGTGILTHAGEKRVERLRAGDQVMTLDRGLQTVRWIGSRRVAATGNLAPIVIATGTFGNCRDLVVSPQHRMVIEGPKAELLFGESQVLVPAKHLLTWDGVYRRSGGTVEYYHLLFDGHEIIYADGALAESFHPGNQALSSVEADAKAEILALFPNLADDTATYGPPARVSLRGYEAEVLGRALAN